MSSPSVGEIPGATTPSHGGDDSTLLAIILSVVAVGLVALVWYFKLAGKKIAETRKKSLVSPNTDFSNRRKSSINKSLSASLAVKLAKTHGLAKLTELDSDAHNIGENGQDNNVLVSDVVAELKNDMDTQRMLIMEDHVSFVYDRNTREREILGKGAFGSVFLGVYMGAEVAVKEITSEQIDADSMGR